METNLQSAIEAGDVNSAEQGPVSQAEEPDAHPSAQTGLVAETNQSTHQIEEVKAATELAGGDAITTGLAHLSQSEDGDTTSAQMKLVTETHDSVAKEENDLSSLLERIKQLETAQLGVVKRWWIFAGGKVSGPHSAEEIIHLWLRKIIKNR